MKMPKFSLFEEDSPKTPEPEALNDIDTQLKLLESLSSKPGGAPGTSTIPAEPPKLVLPSLDQSGKISFSEVYSSQGIQQAALSVESVVNLIAAIPTSLTDPERKAMLSPMLAAVSAQTGIPVSAVSAEVENKLKALRTLDASYSKECSDFSGNAQAQVLAYEQKIRELKQKIDISTQSRVLLSQQIEAETKSLEAVKQYL